MVKRSDGDEEREERPVRMRRPNSRLSDINASSVEVLSDRGSLISSPSASRPPGKIDPPAALDEEDKAVLYALLNLKKRVREEEEEEEEDESSEEECKGASFCVHDRFRSQCWQCKGSKTCEHGRRHHGRGTPARRSFFSKEAVAILNGGHSLH